MSSLGARRAHRVREGETLLEPVRESAAVAARMQARIARLVRRMHAQLMAAVAWQHDEHPPELAQDAASPADRLRDVVENMRDRWVSEFDAMSERIAEEFADEAAEHSERKIRRIMRDAGWTVRRQITPAMRDVLDASVNQSVSLIKSIPQRYFTQVEGMVQRSVQRGGDLKGLTRDLQKEYGVTKRRAALIARDQNRKANASLQRARQLDLGVEEAIWVHSHAGITPRPTHKANNGKRYNVREGWYDPHERKHIQPGELVNCRCFPRAVLPGYRR